MATACPIESYELRDIQIFPDGDRYEKYNITNDLYLDTNNDIEINTNNIETADLYHVNVLSKATGGIYVNATIAITI